MKKDTLILKSDYQPAGDQPKAIAELVKGVKEGDRHQTLLGVTGSGKTFTVANVIEQIQKPTLVIAHNKTLAAQLTQEYREFFPHNVVHYFVSYYDYYQPEAYVPHSDTYIEKEAQVNAEIDRLRHASTQALLTRKDVIIVASVSCIYGLGSPVEYEKVHRKVSVGDSFERAEFIRFLVGLHFERTNVDLTPGTFRAVGPVVEVMPVNETAVYRIQPEGGTIGHIVKLNAVSRAVIDEPATFFLFPAKHYVTPESERESSLADIEQELAVRLEELEAEGKKLEAERLKRRTRYDIALIREIGYTNGIENYSRHFDRRKVGEPPHTLLSYFPHTKDGTPDFLTVIDESHVTVPQLSAMYAGDQSRKKTLIEFGFRLPSASDNRPLTFKEFNERVGQIIYTSATPGAYEKEHSTRTVEQVIRPTGLLDPEIVIEKVTGTKTYPGQVQHFISETERVVKGGGRVLVTTLTKKMAEDLSEFLKEKNIKAEYIHSDIKTIERITILTRFRKGEFDCLVGVNLLREGLDLPEVEFVAILDADKEGFLRSETSLIQTMGRAARNVKGRVILYADGMTPSLEKAIGETQRRREIQIAYNKKNNITPQTIKKSIKDITETLQAERDRAVQMVLAVDMAADLGVRSLKKIIRERKQAMEEAVERLDFETAALLRDEIYKLEEKLPNEKKKAR
ncbi:excinuclease ABC subunit B [Candidatus Kaiserbacteria bacterium CG10_big_fil_rev_8_21_14_0_10_45_20]|uniref:UvrABC system protein B n=1 Tax=Candidatus Kaiserbacteria bacterium CG10_big_fil_rev_8_21_14_0_10_45_20 TaxID=1974607 RepID=A0A2H0UF19_9BACT|nr:MAG: excinuclease ABC subunit B [Candidatus Kaiserbacteria bacterium CG10_big_fil_rev_8_21_14_0_10_45_20]